MRKFLFNSALVLIAGLSLAGCGREDTGAATRSRLDTLTAMMKDPHQQWLRKVHPPALSNHGVRSVHFHAALPPSSVWKQGTVDVVFTKPTGDREVFIGFDNPAGETVFLVNLKEGECRAPIGLDCGDLSSVEWKETFAAVENFGAYHPG